MPSPVLHAVADPFCLEDLAEVNPGFEILWHSKGFGHLGDDQPIAVVAPLVVFHDVRSQVSVFRLGVEFNCLYCWESLETELTHETRVGSPVGGEWLATMPHIPIMGIALDLTVGILERCIG